MLEARFISQEPHTTLGLEITYNVDADPAELEQLTALLAPLGWVRQDQDSFPIPPAPPLPDGTTEICFYKPGTDIVGGWTAEERRSFMPQVRKALRQFGFAGRVPHHRLTWQECI